MDDNNNLIKIPNPEIAAKILLAIMDTSDEPKTIRTVGRFRLFEIIGKGGAGEVYLGIDDDNNNNLVAVKCIDCKKYGKPIYDRVQREITLLERLNLPEVPNILASGGDITDDELWYAQEFIEGFELCNYCTEYNLGKREIVELIIKVCQAVNGLHRAGVIHRDLKPANILITRNGEVRIVDFGISGWITDHDNITIQGTPLGSPGFAAPEQIQYDRDRVGTHSDVYSIGACLYVLLLYDIPEYNRPCDKLSELDEVLAAIIDKAIRIDPDDRYSSAGELANDLQLWLNGDIVVWANPNLWTKTRYIVKSNPPAFIIAIIAIISIFLASILGTNAVINSKYANDMKDQSVQIQALADEKNELVNQIRTNVSKFIQATESKLNSEGEIAEGFDQVRILEDLLIQTKNDIDNGELYVEVSKIRDDAVLDALKIIYQVHKYNREIFISEVEQSILNLQNEQ